MSMIGGYVRLPPEEMARVLDDPEWGGEHVEALMEKDSPRYVDVEKAWAAIGFALRRAGFPVDVVEGGETVAGADDWGYGPPRHLTPEEVRRAADALAAVGPDALVGRVDPTELAAADVYPQIWDEPDALDYVREHFHALARFLAAAARDGDAVVLWLS